ncbi:MAG: HMA2 domain-containing protein [Desulfomonilaceae bacterium]
MSFYLHNTPGRMRIKIPALKRNPNLADDLYALLHRRSGVKSLQINTLTGSIKINFDESMIKPSTLVGLLSLEGHLDPSRIVSTKKYMDKVFSEAGGTISRAILGLVLDKAFEGSSLSILTMLI